MAKERILKEAVSNEVRKPCCRLAGTRSCFSLQRLSALGSGASVYPAPSMTPAPPYDHKDRQEAKRPAK